MRKLASVQVVESVSPIPDADAIETVRVLGWDVVVRKSFNFQPGDRVIFFEIDSVLPNVPRFEEMLRGKPWSPRAARLKTVKFRGQISQGYTVHAADFPETDGLGVGTDVTELLRVTKYEPPLPTDTQAIAGHWLIGVPKTDEPRVQSEPQHLAALQGQPYVITVKMDGMSGTFGFDDDGVFWACSRNFRLKRNPDTAHWAVAIEHGLEEVLAGSGLVIQGEVCGPGIQGNKLGLTKPTLYVFNVWDTMTHAYFTHRRLEMFCTWWGLNMVPVLEVGDNFLYTAEELLEKAEGLYPSGKQREGIVIRHRDQDTVVRISFKAISNTFLIQEK